VLGALGVVAPVLAEQPAGDDAVSKYLGVVTCAGSTCHGAPRPLDDSRVMQNEFIIWHREDEHAKAYQALLDERGQRIARNLGIDDATGADECLVCHATRAAPGARGKRFKLSDGVGCERCHGPASRWLGQHVTGEASRADNIALGMYPTEEPRARAALCLDCHLGKSGQFGSHRLMGAGHPRLSFELDTFTRLQPAHFRADADYRQRKRVASGLQVWAVGQALAATRLLEQLEGSSGDGTFPEFAFFDCHACHHPFSTPRWQPRAGVPLPPGQPHLNDSSLMMVLALARHLDTTRAAQIEREIGALHGASTRSMADTRAAAATLRASIAAFADGVAVREFSSTDISATLRGVATAGAAGEYRDYASAEQAAMAIGALVDALDEAGALDDVRRTALRDQVEVLMRATADQDRYDAASVVAALAELVQRLD